MSGSSVDVEITDTDGTFPLVYPFLFSLDKVVVSWNETRLKLWRMEQLTELTLVDTVLHFSLFLGALLQLICIFAVVFVPTKKEDKVCTARREHVSVDAHR